ncbi:hypothetical protein [Isoptericola sp. NPDC056605]|uniref:hypothetical protein n=1 Tax=Isoptericola sp. NPDC056605 TaxID=3345876 RepID=UPI0036C7EBD7
MAREYARFNVAIWQDDDFRALPADAQHLYFLLWTHPELTYCGVVDWRPGKLTGFMRGRTRDDLETIARCLEARLFIVIDQDTEEVLVRSWARFDGLMRQPRMAVSFANAFAGVGSTTIRGVLVHEARKIQKREPDLAGWSKPSVAELLEREPLDPRSRPLPEDPFGSGFGTGLGPVSVPFGANATEGLGPVSVPPTPAPTPTPSSGSPADAAAEDPKPKPERTNSNAVLLAAGLGDDDRKAFLAHLREAGARSPSAVVLSLDANGQLADRIAEWRDVEASKPKRPNVGVDEWLLR